jgi:hypothetical protein
LEVRSYDLGAFSFRLCVVLYDGVVPFRVIALVFLGVSGRIPLGIVAVLFLLTEGIVLFLAVCVFLRIVP